MREAWECGRVRASFPVWVLYLNRRRLELKGRKQLLNEMLDEIYMLDNRKVYSDQCVINDVKELVIPTF